MRCGSSIGPAPSSGEVPPPTCASWTKASRGNTARWSRDGKTVRLRDLRSTNGTFCRGASIETLELADGDKILVGSGTVLKFTYHDKLDEEFQRQMLESVLRDDLTKAFNKKYFLDRVESEFAYALRHNLPVALVSFDIDHFKQANDSFGHLAGDHVLDRGGGRGAGHGAGGRRVRADRRARSSRSSVGAPT